MVFDTAFFGKSFFGSDKNEMLLFVTCQLSAVGVGLGACGCHYMWYRGKGGWEGRGEEGKRAEGRRESVKSVCEPPHNGEAQQRGVLRSVVKFSELFQACRFGSVRQQEGRVVSSLDPVVIRVLVCSVGSSCSDHMPPLTARTLCTSFW